MLAGPVIKKEPITPDMLSELVKDVNKNPSLSNVRLATACLLAFAAFLRFDELVHIRPCNIAISPEMATIQIPRSKTDQLRRGAEVIVARSHLPTCPVAMLERYM